MRNPETTRKSSRRPEPLRVSYAKMIELKYTLCVLEKEQLPTVHKASVENFDALESPPPVQHPGLEEWNKRYSDDNGVMLVASQEGTAEILGYVFALERNLSTNGIGVKQLYIFQAYFPAMSALLTGEGFKAKEGGVSKEKLSTYHKQVNVKKCREELSVWESCTPCCSFELESEPLQEDMFDAMISWWYSSSIDVFGCGKVYQHDGTEDFRLSYHPHSIEEVTSQ
ncbi:hypothetical protein CYMTET_40902 [Cymbomonas tetramitiformis]|uniref:Uncharacterized protein n=1 Tax=Cymbomonas tetramitiformis TaxID=36881 RepID=A0AAE0C766_9CHLO|nr:hypothetical protein CYMTET_40902 [Cymbomonas tetramitiformis]